MNRSVLVNGNNISTRPPVIYVIGCDISIQQVYHVFGRRPAKCLVTGPLLACHSQYFGGTVLFLMNQPFYFHSFSIRQWKYFFDVFWRFVCRLWHYKKCRVHRICCVNIGGSLISLLKFLTDICYITKQTVAFSSESGVFLIIILCCNLPRWRQNWRSVLQTYIAN